MIDEVVKKFDNIERKQPSSTNKSARKKHDQKKRRDLKGKQFSCYPFLTSLRYRRQHKAAVEYNTAPI